MVFAFLSSQKIITKRLHSSHNKLFHNGRQKQNYQRSLSNKWLRRQKKVHWSPVDSKIWEEILGNCGSGAESLPMQPNNEHEILDQILDYNARFCQSIGVHVQKLYTVLSLFVWIGYVFILYPFSNFLLQASTESGNKFKIYTWS